MLKWEEVKFVFNESVLNVGDILLMNSYHEGQRKKVQGRFDHVAMYLGDAYLIEADGLGVTMSHLYSYGFKAEEDACVMRLKEPDDEIIKKAVRYAKTRMGMEFGVKEAFKVRLEKHSQNQEHSNRTFCSRLIGQAYNDAGIKLVENPDYCAPDDFLTSFYLETVQNPLIAKPEELRKTFEKTQNERENSEYLTALPEAFESFSKLYGEDIQTMSQLLIAGMHHPDKDDEAVKLLNSIKMFSPEEDTVKMWPWFNKDEDFFAHYPETEDELFFIVNQFMHFDKTYLPACQQNLVTTSALRVYIPHSKMIAAINDGFGAVYREEVRIRMRLADLYAEVFARDEKGFNDFADEYGIYHDFEFENIINVDLSQLLL